MNSLRENCCSVRCPQRKTEDCEAPRPCAEDSARYSAFVLKS
jgi:hypothetical protein